MSLPWQKQIELEDLEKDIEDAELAFKEARTEALLSQLWVNSRSEYLEALKRKREEL